MKNLFKIAGILFLSLFIDSCTKDDSPASSYSPPAVTIVSYKATLSGTNETTPNASTATGVGLLLYNSTTKIFTLSVTHTLATATMGHIHRGAAGENGAVVFPFTTFTSPFVYTSAALYAAQEADLAAGLYYINLHSAAFPSGEIRGNLIKQ